ncbi:MAG TPA: Ger(x)C family spore germination protein [Caproiciproducens sp.]|nr:Ger(x)C family spore germination protein [Caproiciproducens sp.]
MKTVRRIFVLLLTVNMVFLSGCWNYREVDNMLMVAGMALDAGKEGFKYHATFELLDLSQGKTGSKLLETEGDSLFECARNAIGKTKKKLFFSHCKLVVISNQLASEGVTPLFDFLMRDSEPRINLDIIVSKESTAGDILQQKPVSDQLVSIEISDQLKQNTASLGEAPNVKLYQANNMLADSGTSLILPTVKISKDKTKATELDGTAVFKKDRLIGYLNRNETKYLLFVNNKIKGGLLLSSPENDKNFITVEISDNKTKIQPEVKDTDVTVNIQIKTRGALGEDETSKDYSTVSGIKEAAKSSEKEISYGVNEVIKKVQMEYGSDIFGFGSKIHQDSPETWKKLKDNWTDTFRKLKFTVTANVDIENTATARGKVGT